ncbi:hypothetical protein P691DRAFT_801993 [Macrolepiota fuliginosa MF-IS2]|uniref:UBA domain-containing protein n=1 Tax=Macrolepiota fuliginosa MF-IS2 TaxID=1400762 RepID=A0A9P5XLM9_9AGAR|nr:hypothetical protein P691DRAFT_801993 [Macrolepiota fuliginosa MF-IS2]
MSDSFADLWNSSVPQKKPQTLSSLAQQPTQQRRPGGPDLFTLLSSSSGPTRSSPSLTPNNSTPPPTNQRTPQQPHTRSTTAQSTGGADAFSDLLSSSSFTSSTSTQNLTIAQRAALADKQRQEALLARQKQQEKEKSAWAGLDSLGGGSSGFGGLTPTRAPAATSNGSAKPVSKVTVASGLMDDDELGDFGKPAIASSQDRPAVTNNDQRGDWDFSAFSQPGPTKSSAYSTTTTATANNVSNSSKTLWDLDEFSSPSASPKPDSHSRSARPQAPAPWTDSPSDNFDFGSREDGDGLLSNEDDRDDFMSVFNKPALPPRPASTSIAARNQGTSSPAPTNHAASSTTRTASGSPPPHILGQIVEMGFSIPKAKAALAANNNDVQAALDQLLASETGSSSGGHGTPAHRESVTNSPAPGATSQQQQQQQQPSIPRRRDREILRDREREQRRGDTASPSGSGTGDVQTQAEQLLAQASEIGRGMFTKASLFWKEKREQVQKVVEEQVSGVRASSAGSNSTGSAGGGAGGRPKWMQQQHSGSVDNESESPRRGGLGDDAEREPEVKIPRRLDRQRERERERERARDREPTAPNPAPPVEEPEINLFAPSEPSTAPQLFDSFDAQSTPGLSQRPRTQTSTRPRQRSKFQRDTTPIPPSIAALKAEANVTFKLGQFGAAETLYTRAIDSLSSSASSNHTYYVLLLNNRANARIKVGDISGAVKDCEGVVGLITRNQLTVSPGGSGGDEFDALGGGGKAGSAGKNNEEVVKFDWEPSHDGDGKLHIPIQGEEGETVDLGEGLVKAIKRRAEAYEGMEKWSHAKRDWEWLRSVGWVRESVRGEAGRGVGRCTRMVGGGGGANGSNSGLGGGNLNGSSSASSSSRPSSVPKPKPKPRSTPKPATPVNNNKPSEALQNLRTTTAQAEAEDQAKHELKDTIDAKLSAWKSGKETNIRALLASLDTVLWEELLSSGGGSVKVGMHELVTPGQVKVKYMKAVAKVHPDKVNTGNSTLEQKMIAQGVFGALNEAWNAFKQ